MQSGDFFIGTDRLTETSEEIFLKSSTLLRHMMAIGSSGSGKTVLSKVLTEEFLLSEIPAICLDPQGDLCSLALAVDDDDFLRKKGLDPKVAKAFREKVEVVLFTPASRKGIALATDPVKVDLEGLSDRESIYAISNIASMIVSLLGYDLDSDDGSGLAAVLDQALSDMHRRGSFPSNLEELTSWFTGLEDEDKEEYAKYLDTKKMDQACRKMARLDVGAKRLLFHEGLSLDIDLLLGRGRNAAATKGKTRLSIIYLNSLQSQEDKEFFVAALTEQLYSWMLKNPAKKPQALFYIDEVAPYIPPVRKPACKPGLTLLFKQARKYGVCCLMATQNPADVDYKAMSQFGTWAIGRLTTRQDMKKVQPTVKSLDPVAVDTIMAELPSHNAGQFVLISPDNFKETVRLQTRWLYTAHDTFDEERIEEVTDNCNRSRFDALEERLTGRAQKASPRKKKKSKASLEKNVTRLNTVEPQKKKTEKTVLPVESEIVDASVEVPVVAEKLEPITQANNQKAVKQEKNLKVLGKKPSLSAQEFAGLAKMSEGTARNLLKKLVQDGLAGSYKDGRVTRYWSRVEGMRPDIGIVKKLDAIVPVIVDKDGVGEKGKILRSRKLLGVFGDDEELERAELEYRLILRISFREKVTRPLWRRVFGDRHDELLDNLYLHPVDLRVLVFDAKMGVRFEEQPDQYASRIDDFDGVTTFEKVSPGEVLLRENDWRERKNDDEVKESFKKRFRATPSKVDPILLPTWSIQMQRKGKGAKRLVVIDALTGNTLNL